jgi:hypothetical protein
MSKGGVTAEFEGKPAEKPPGRSLFTYKAIATTLGGSLLTLCVAVAQITYANHLEVLRRQGEQGLAFQDRLLDLTGRMESELSHILNIVRHSNTPERAVREELLAEADQRMEENLAPLYRQWGMESLLLRNRGAQIYGNEVGELIYNPADDSFQENNCSMVVRDVDPPANRDCARLMEMERSFLHDFVAEIRQSGTLEPFRRSARSPKSFQANAAIARTVLHRYIVCAGSDARPDLPPRCAHMPQALEIAIRRVELVGVARENLADAIVARSALQD